MWNRRPGLPPIQKRIHILSGMLLLFLALFHPLPSLAGTPPEPGTVVTGYFTDMKYLRPAMKATWENVDRIPAYTMIEITVVQGYWGEAVSEKGVKGYINFQDMRPAPAPEPCEPWQGYCTEKAPFRAFPEIKLEAEEFLRPQRLLVVNGTLDYFYHVTLADGRSGYVLQKSVKKAEFHAEKVQEKRFCVGRETPVREYPLDGAAEIGRLSPGEIYVTDSQTGDYYVVSVNGAAGYIYKGSLKIWARSPGSGILFFRDARLQGKRDDEEAKVLCAQAAVGDAGAVLHGKPGKSVSLSPDEKIYVYAVYGGFCGVSCDAGYGYVREDAVRIMDREAMLAEIRGKDLSGASLRASPFLDQALAMLEEGNPFLLRYCALTGADVRALFPLGVPYFWGGRGYNVLTERWPEYTVREAWQSSLVYYHKGTNYVFGFDCIGFVKNVYRLAGFPISDTVESLGEKEYCEAHHVFCSDRRPVGKNWAETAKSLRAGDLLYVHHPNPHAMIYIGTLRDWGYTAEQLPALANALDDPLMIQCGENPSCHFRFRDLLSQQQSGLLADAEPTDGGVCVCIIGPKKKEAEQVVEAHGVKCRCFDVEGACVTLFDFNAVKSYFVYRPTIITRGTGTDEASGKEAP